MNMSGDSEMEKSTFLKFVIGWIVSGLIGCALIAYPTYDERGTVDVALPLASILGPLALAIGVVHLASEGYTTIKVKEQK